MLGKELGLEPQGEVLALLALEQAQVPPGLELGLEPHSQDRVPHVGTPGNNQGHSRMERTWSWNRRHPVGPRRNRRTQEQRLEQRTCGKDRDGSLGRHPQERTSSPLQVVVLDAMPEQQDEVLAQELGLEQQGVVLELLALKQVRNKLGPRLLRRFPGRSEQELGRRTPEPLPCSERPGPQASAPHRMRKCCLLGR